MKEKKEIELVISIDPLPKQRPRFGNGRTYTPYKTKKYEESIRVSCKSQYCNAPLSGPLTAEVYFLFKRPPSIRRANHDVRPDLDNLLKALFDGMNGILFKDDAQIVRIMAYKKYSDTDGRICVRLSQFDESDTL